MSTGLNLLDPALMRRLDQMSIAAKSRIRGTMQGRRRSKDQGSSLEFADYRLYTPGDDTRQLDWHAYGRTGKPFIKLFMDEQELQVHLWLDASKSMDFGQKDGSGSSKWAYARQLAAGIGYLALNRFDRVSAAMFTTQITRQMRLVRGKGSAPRLFEFLTGGQPLGEGDIGAVFRNPACLPRQAGMTWLFSDFLYEQGIEESLKYLLAAKQEVIVVQVLAPEEINPSFSGELRLIDSESGAAREVAMSSKVLESYRAAVQQYTQSLKAFCYERGITYLLAVTDIPPGDFLLGTLRNNGLVR
ncbi:hypothetical protein GCM10008018_01870 [Paenibacillus marchantiophytorum]|uniref:DUF58 domain-containing protein n=1 Tax=Paenibacillus marchantiophytorum TaxID=1619310 RepID=A0ABQ2BQ57_9BACL|nr:DUF58 domain-containing protein [Paenibacillus marchantiophytorum]GGI43398.1 hypothetical protein GCM10008018_01870 [Paenibacillus marchantiophytorum]